MLCPSYGLLPHQHQQQQQNQMTQVGQFHHQPYQNLHSCNNNNKMGDVELTDVPVANSTSFRHEVALGQEQGGSACNNTNYLMENMNSLTGSVGSSLSISTAVVDPVSSMGMDPGYNMVGDGSATGWPFGGEDEYSHWGSMWDFVDPFLLDF